MNFDNGQINFKVTLDTTALEQARERVSGEFQKMTDSAKSSGGEIGSVFDSMESKAKSLAVTIAGGMGFTELAKKVISVRGEFQSLQLSFETMLGSAQKASTLFNQLVQTAAKTPFGVTDISAAAKSLLAYGVSADKVNETLIRLGDISAGLGLDIKDLSWLYGTTLTQGRVFARDVYQFSGRGIPIIQELAKQFGVSKDKVMDLVSAGKVGFPQIQKMIEDLTNEGGQFAGLMDKLSGTVTGKLSNLEDAFDMMLNNIGQQTEGAIYTGIDLANTLVENYQKVGQILLDIIATYGVAKAAVMTLAAVHTAEANYMINGYNALLIAHQNANNADIEELAISGRISASKAQELIEIRAKIQAKIQELQTSLAQARTEEVAARLAYKNALQASIAAKQELTVKQHLYQMALKSGNAEELEAGKTALNTAKKEVQTATINKQNAAKVLNEATTKRNAIATELDTVTTGADTVAKGANSAATSVLAAAHEFLAKAIDKVRIAMAKNPLTILAVVATTVIGTIMTLNDTLDDTTEKTDDMRSATDLAGEVAQNVSSAYSDEIDKIQKLNDKIHNNKLSIDERKKAIQAMQKILPSYKAGIKQTGKLYNDNTTVIYAYIAALKAAAEAEAAYAVRKSVLESKLKAQMQYGTTADVKQNNINRNVYWGKKYGVDFSKGQYVEGRTVGNQQLYTVYDANGKIIGGIKPEDANDVLRIQREFRENSEAHDMAVSTAKTKTQGYDRQIAWLDKYIQTSVANAQAEAKKVDKNMTVTWDEGSGKVLINDKHVGDTETDTTTKETDAVKKESDITKKIQELAEERQHASAKRRKEIDAEIQRLNQQKAAIDKAKGIGKPTKPTTKHGKTGHTETQADREQEAKEYYDEFGKEIIKAQNSMQDDINKNAIDTMSAGTEKQVAQINANKAKELAALDKTITDLAQKKMDVDKKAWLKVHPKAGAADYAATAQGKQTLDDYKKSIRSTQIVDSNGKTTTVGGMEHTLAASINAKYDKQLRDATAKADDAMDDYLAKYGSFAKREQAIRRKYERKIKDSENEGSAKQAQKDMESQLSSLYIEKLKRSINWDVVFNNIDALTTQELRKLKEKIDKYKKSDEYKKLSPTDQKTIADASANLNKTLIDSSGIFGGLKEATKQYQQALEEYNDALKELQLALSVQQWADKANNKPLKAMADKWVEMAQQKVNEKEQNKQTSGANLQTAARTTTDKVISLANAIGQLGSQSEMSLSDIGSMAENITNIFTKEGSKIGGIIGAIFSLLDVINKQGIDKFIGNLFESVFGAVGEVLDTVSFGLFDSGNVKKTEKEIANLAASNADLESAIDRLTEVMKDQAGKEATSTYHSTREKLNEDMENTRKMIKAAAGEYSNGTLGIGGKHSANKKINQKLSTDDWALISKVVGKNVTNAGDLWNLSSEDMAKIANQATSVYTKIKQAGGKHNPGEYMDQYIEYYQKLIDLQKEYNETITSLSFDDAKDGLKELLQDVSKGVKDAKKQVRDYMIQAVIENLVNGPMKSQMDTWYQKFADAMSDGILTATEKKDLQDRYLAAYNSAVKQRDAAYAAAGINPKDDEDTNQNGTTSSFGSMTSDQGEEMNGRLTSIQIHVSSIDAIMSERGNSGEVVKGYLETTSVRVTDIYNVLFICQGYLEDISKSNNELYEINERVGKMQRKLDTL